MEPFDASAANELASIIDAARRIPRILADLAVPRASGESFRITDHQVRVALAPQDHPTRATPFAWSARTTRRALGLAGVRALVSGAARSPVEAVRAVIDDAVRAADQGEASASAMDCWLAGLPPAGRVAVHADAVTWATRLWCALDWSALEGVPAIGRDHWWDSPHSSLLALRSRAEVRSIARDATGKPFSVHLVVLGGSRRPTIRSELSVAAMVEVLAAPASLPPGRIVGWWADSGRAIALEIDQAALAAGMAAVTRTMASLGTRPAHHGGPIRAAA